MENKNIQQFNEILDEKAKYELSSSFKLFYFFYKEKMETNTADEYSNILETPTKIKSLNYLFETLSAYDQTLRMSTMPNLNTYGNFGNLASCTQLKLDDEFLIQSKRVLENIMNTLDNFEHIKLM